MLHRSPARAQGPPRAILSRQAGGGAWLCGLRCPSYAWSCMGHSCVPMPRCCDPHAADLVKTWLRLMHRRTPGSCKRRSPRVYPKTESTSPAWGRGQVRLPLRQTLPKPRSSHARFQQPWTPPSGHQRPPSGHQRPHVGAGPSAASSVSHRPRLALVASLFSPLNRAPVPHRGWVSVSDKTVPVSCHDGDDGRTQRRQPQRVRLAAEHEADPKGFSRSRAFLSGVAVPGCLSLPVRAVRLLSRGRAWLESCPDPHSPGVWPGGALEPCSRQARRVTAPGHRRPPRRPSETHLHIPSVFFL